MYCINCRYPLTGLDKPSCPECGRSFQPTDASTYLTATPSVRWLHVPVGLAILFVMVAGVLWLSGDVWRFVNLPAILWTAGILLGGLWLSFGPANVWRALVAAGTMRSHLDRDTAAIHLLVFARAYQLAWAAGMIGLLLSLITVLGNLSDPWTIGPGLAFALTPLLYGALLAEFVFAPLQQAIATRAGQSGLHLPLLAMPHRSSQGLALALTFAVLAACLVFILASV